jgi:acyl-CoA synthetase (AMP-forming)/AMP-acid ligase II
MRLTATHPPPPDAVARYRSTGWWRPPQPRSTHLAAIAAGESRIALVDATSQWTYAQLAAAVDELDQSLTEAGVGADDTVLIVAPLRIAAAAAYLGTVLHGAVAVLLDRRCGDADLINAVCAANPKVALAFDDDAERLGLARLCEVVSLDQIGTEAEPKLRGSVQQQVDPDIPAVVLFTSGTTNTPKAVIHTMNSLRCGAANMIAALNIGPDDAFFLSSPLASITGLVQLESALTMQAKVILDDKFSPERSLERVCDFGATVMGGAPFLVESIFDEAARRKRSVPLRCIAVGGSMVPQTMLDKAARIGVRAIRVYGSSEAPFSTATGPDAEAARRDDGVPMPGVEVGLHGRDDELVIRGPHQFHGYLDPTHNLDAFRGDWVRTGDQADVDGGRVRIKGRLKEVVVRKGMKISLSEIDSAAAALGECAAFAVPDDTTGERLALAVRGTDAQHVSYLAVVEHLTAAGLAKWKLPEQIIVWDGPLPRTASGKVNRRGLFDDRHHLKSIYAPRLAAGASD